jgi:rhomboid protease GluP
VTVCEACGKPFEGNAPGAGASYGSAPSRCPDCTAKSAESAIKPKVNKNQAAAEFRAELNRIAPARPILTWGLIALCTAVFVLEIAKGAGFDTMSPTLAIQLGADFGPLTITGQWWRMLTSMFLHFGFFHLAMNMWCLFMLGPLAERVMGRAAFLVLYFGTGLAGSLLSLAVHPILVSAGASGAIFGVVGGLVTYLWLKKAPLDFARVKLQLRSLGIFIAYNILYSLRSGVDMMAHVGGLVAGLAIGAMLPAFLEIASPNAIPTPMHERGSNSKRVAGVGIACLIGLVAGTGAVRHFQGDTVYVWSSLAQIDAGHSADVLPNLEQIVKRQPDSGLAHFALGTAYLQLDRLDDAVPELQKAFEIDPADPDFKKQLDLAMANKLMRDNFKSQ